MAIQVFFGPGCTNWSAAGTLLQQSNETGRIVFGLFNDTPLIAFPGMPNSNASRVEMLQNWQTVRSEQQASCGND